MASNATTITDEDNDFEDWVELYNGTDSIINLKDFWLSDNLSQPDKWKFPEVFIYPDDFLLIFASGKDKYDSVFVHTNFKISISGEPIILSDSLGNFIDSLGPVTLTTDNAYGRLPDGSNNLVFFSGSSPGFSNNLQPLLIPFADTISFSLPSGFYVDSFMLDISNIDSGSAIFYTTNGSDPDLSSPLYTSPLIISKNLLSNTLSIIPTNTDEAQHPYHWRPPAGNVFKGTIIKARSFKNGLPSSDILVGSYFVDDSIFIRYNNLPVISIVTDSVNLFCYENGIYVPGKLHDDNPNFPDWWGYGNYFGRDIWWERPAHITFFEGDGTFAFSQHIGIRIHGNSTRALPQKSLRLYARNLYGKNSFDYKFFPWRNVENYSRILLRNAGNDFPYNMFVDGMSSLFAEWLSLEKQDYRPSVVFFNGEFWGIHNIRDRLDGRFLEYMFNINENDIDYLDFWGYASIGSDSDYYAMENLIRHNDITDNTIYNLVANQMDIDNFIDYIIAKQYTAVYDWPGNNVNIWRNKKNNGKWRWIFFDNDNAFENYNFDAIAHSTLEGGTNWPNPDMSTFLIRNLLKNDTFQQKYLDKFEYYLTYVFTEENINQLIDSITEIIRPVMHEHIARWQYPLTVSEWENNVQKMKDFAKYRPCFMKEHLIEHFNITDTTYAQYVCVDIEIPDTLIPFDTISEFHISLYPNPANENLNLVFDNDIKGSVECVIYDITGRVVFNESFFLTNSAHITIPVFGFSKGIYIMEIITNDIIEYKKIILE